MIRITTLSGKAHEGSLYAIDPVTRSVVLKSNETFTVVNSNSIASINGDLPTSGIFADQLVPSQQEIRSSEETALRNLEKSLESINRNVPGNIQQLFDKFSSVYPHCSWQQNNIIVMSDYVIEGPSYSEVKVLPGRVGSNGIDRISKMLQGERQRLKIN